jgi:hypothetical protein
MHGDCGQLTAISLGQEDVTPIPGLFLGFPFWECWEWSD